MGVYIRLVEAPLDAESLSHIELVGSRTVVAGERVVDLQHIPQFLHGQTGQLIKDVLTVGLQHLHHPLDQIGLAGGDAVGPGQLLQSLLVVNGLAQHVGVGLLVQQNGVHRRGQLLLELGGPLLILILH